MKNKLRCLLIILLFIFLTQNYFAQKQESLAEYLRYYGLVDNATPADIARLADLKKKISTKRFPPEQLVQNLDNIAAEVVEFFKLVAKLRKSQNVLTDQQFLAAARGIVSGSLAQFADCSTVLANQSVTPLGKLGKVEKFGKGKTVLILLPGALTNISVLKSFIERNQHLYTIYVITLPGDMGTAPPPRPEKFDASATPWWDNAGLGLVNFIKKAKLKKPVIVGNQSGAYLAAKLALNHPENIGSVILLNGLVYPTPMRSPANTERAAALQERKQTMFNRNLNSFMLYDIFPLAMPDKSCAERFINNSLSIYQSFMLSRTKDLERAKQITVDALTTSNPSSIRYITELNNTDLTEELKNLRVPMLSITAVPDKDSPSTILAFPQWSEIKTLYPNIPLMVVPFENTSGNLNENEPLKLDQTIADFLRNKRNILANELKDLSDKKQYFDLRDKLGELPSDKSNEIIFYRGVVANKFNSPTISIKLLNQFLKKTVPGDVHLKECYSLLADNYVKTFQYAKAAETYRKLLQNFSQVISGEEKASYENVANLWGRLSKVAPQKVVKKADSAVQGIQELVGLTVPLEINGRKEAFIFDTGANISTVSETFAQQLKLQIIEAQIEVGSISGTKVKAKLGVAKTLKLGNFVIQNAVFIVFPDSVLYIAPIKYQINGILGFPVIEALKEITWTKNKQILISANPKKSGEHNLAIEDLTPLIVGKYKEKRLTFAFDTGANTSSLFQPFFKDFEKEITEKGESYLEKITGVGGTKEIKAYLLKDVEMNFAGKTSKFNKIEVLTEKTTGSSEYFYGNIGRDWIEQFEKMTLNFESMSISFD